MCSGFLRVPRVSGKLPVSAQDSHWVLLSQAYFCSAVAFHSVVSFKTAVILAIKNQSWDVVWICLHLLGLWQSNAWKSSILSVTKLLFQHAVLCQKLHNLINWIQTEQKYYFKLINGKLKKSKWKMLQDVWAQQGLACRIIQGFMVTVLDQEFGWWAEMQYRTDGTMLCSAVFLT